MEPGGRDAVELQDATALGGRDRVVGLKLEDAAVPLGLKNPNRGPLPPEAKDGVPGSFWLFHAANFTRHVAEVTIAWVEFGRRFHQ